MGRDISKEEAEDFISVLERELRNGGVPRSSKYYTELERAKELLNSGDFAGSVEVSRSTLRDYKNSQTTRNEPDTYMKKKNKVKLAGYLLITVVILNLLNGLSLYLSLNGIASNNILEMMPAKMKLTVEGPDSNPLSDATVTVYRFKNPQKISSQLEQFGDPVTTNNQGMCTISIHPGLFQIWVSHPDTNTLVMNISVPLGGISRSIKLDNSTTGSGLGLEYAKGDKVSETSEFMGDIILFNIFWTLAMTVIVIIGAYSIFAKRSKRLAMAGSVAAALSFGPLMICLILGIISVVVISTRWDRN